MKIVEQYREADDPHPIDIVQSIAAHQAWDFKRIGDDQISVTVKGQWKTYSVTLAWTESDETLRLICTFDMDPPEDRIAPLYEVLNLVNGNIWAGSFTYWADHSVMVYRYGLILHGGQIASKSQIDGMIAAAVHSAERYYPAFQLVTWGGRHPEDALQVAIAEAYGRA